MTAVLTDLAAVWLGSLYRIFRREKPPIPRKIEIEKFFKNAILVSSVNSEKREAVPMIEKPENIWYYDVYPKVVPVGRPVEITIRALSRHAYFKDGAQLTVVPINFYPDREGEAAEISATQQEIKFTYTFPTEQEYQLRVFDNAHSLAARLAVYALEDDLLSLKPLIGDFHGHSCLSDGKEGPEFVAARYREEGFDFFTLTDHRRYAGSVELQKTFEELHSDFQIYAGEEIHTPNNPVHLINFGSDAPVNVEYLTEEALQDENCWNDSFLPEWMDRVQKVQDGLEIPEDVDPFIYSSCVLAANLVREKGGMCILAHPHWRWTVKNVPDALTRLLLTTGAVDAFEVVGGQAVRENTSQLAMYHEMRAEGIRIPLVCSSDSHGTCSNVSWGNKPDDFHMFTEERTMVFAADNTKEDIMAAVKGLKSVALEQYEGEPCRVHGPYRLVPYALFLLHEYFPIQDDLCREEGCLMRRFIAGDSQAKARLQEIGHQTTKLREKYFVPAQ